MYELALLAGGLVLFGALGWESGKRLRRDGFKRATLEHLATSLFLLIGAVTISFLAADTWSTLLRGYDAGAGQDTWREVAHTNLLFAVTYVFVYVGLAVAAWKRTAPDAAT